ncbi:DDE-type integrase/transposase/recombinase [Curtobacterium pusillum]|uniref:DDE-type integrase/transposase/recombinase n=1 Tax=Curtobacterium pusillum TaxID=69373 RepID=UPI0015FCA868|nr:DDE-type integrase/transposase/recombinase [Curtobacterium pusillum]
MGKVQGRKNSGKRGRGYAFLHHAVDDHSRLVFSEIHGDERTETVIGFWRRAREFFDQAGCAIEAVMTDNGPAYADRLHHYNHHRPHTGLGGRTPSDRVHNLTGNDT